MMSDIIEGILQFLFHCFIEIICFFTGEIILYLLTFGYKKPRWNYYTDASPSTSVIMSELSVWIGMAFWIFSIGAVARFFS
jgi:hypothetical protein